MTATAAIATAVSPGRRCIQSTLVWTSQAMKAPTAPTISERVQPSAARRDACARLPRRCREQAGQQQGADETELGERLQLDRMRLVDVFDRAPLLIVGAWVVARAYAEHGFSRHTRHAICQ